MARRYIGRPFEKSDLAAQGEQFRVFLHLGKDVPIISAQNKAIGTESPRVFDFLFHGFFENDLLDEGDEWVHIYGFMSVRSLGKPKIPFSSKGNKDHNITIGIVRIFD